MLDYLWRWFLDLSYDRDIGFGIGYIKSSEYEAWSRLNRVEISPSELAVLKTLDRAFVCPMDDPTETSSLFNSLKHIDAQNKAKRAPAR